VIGKQAHIFLIINIYNRIVQRRFCLYGSWGYYRVV